MLEECGAMVEWSLMEEINETRRNCCSSLSSIMNLERNPWD
jgi:hypothetical protein